MLDTARPGMPCRLVVGCTLAEIAEIAEMSVPNVGKIVQIAHNAPARKAS